MIQSLITANASIRKNGAQFSNLSGLETEIPPHCLALAPTYTPSAFLQDWLLHMHSERLASVRA